MARIGKSELGSRCIASILADLAYAHAIRLGGETVQILNRKGYLGIRTCSAAI